VRTVSPIFNTVWPFAIFVVQVICWRMKLKYGNIKTWKMGNFWFSEFLQNIPYWPG
jgi:hypothetical protein